jgi:hypothetical protein
MDVSEERQAPPVKPSRARLGAEQQRMPVAFDSREPLTVSEDFLAHRALNAFGIKADGSAMAHTISSQFVSCITNSSERAGDLAARGIHPSRPSCWKAR